MNSQKKISCEAFYSRRGTSLGGHTMGYLRALVNTARALHPDRPIIWLVGDLSLDTTADLDPGPYWYNVPGSPTLPSFYQQVFDEPQYCRPDVAFWVNHILGDAAICINGAVAGSTLGESRYGKSFDKASHCGRDGAWHLPEIVVRNFMDERDILVVSVGASDLYSNRTKSTKKEQRRVFWGPNNDVPIPSEHVQSLFKTQQQRIVDNICHFRIPRAIIVCTPYLPLRYKYGKLSRKDLDLNMLGYDIHPRKAKEAMKIIDKCCRRVTLNGAHMSYLRLFESLRGTQTEDYKDRVRLSERGGLHIAELIVDKVRDILFERKLLGGRMSYDSYDDQMIRWARSIHDFPTIPATSESSSSEGKVSSESKISTPEDKNDSNSSAVDAVPALRGSLSTIEEEGSLSASESGDSVDPVTQNTITSVTDLMADFRKQTARNSAHPSLFTDLDLEGACRCDAMPDPHWHWD